MLSSVPWRLKQEDPEMKAILSYIESVLKKKKSVKKGDDSCAGVNSSFPEERPLLLAAWS